ncbi:terpene synthase family protein [Spirillospora sp. NPDC047279]|uniref:terpene synthase family protein n=1 Tax=Spirillospora sp. NPDC047279 TaxID=3155478 RepID=UPI0033FD7697
MTEEPPGPVHRSPATALPAPAATATASATADAVRAAAEHGRLCGVVSQAQRDLQSCVEKHSGLFDGKPFDATLLGAVSSANVFGSPDDPAERLEIANRTSLWIFGLDWLVDYRARTRADLDGIEAECRAAAADEPYTGGSPLGAFLREIRDRLATAPAFAERHPVWRDELERMLAAMAREWEWKTASARPTFDDYLANADNFGSTFVNVSHWIFTGDAAALSRLDALRAVSRKVQQVLRLLNDLATYRRDVTWGDLNALLLGVDRDAVTRRIGELVDECHTALGPLHEACPREAVYLERQIGYSMGFYGIADYWGRL